MNLLYKIDKLIVDTIVTGDVSQNTAKGKVDVVGGKCPEGYVYDKEKKTCVPAKNEGYVYVYNNKKNKRIRISDDLDVIKKYEKKGYVIETTVASAVVGSGQTRVWGRDFNLIDALETKEPVDIEMADKAKENIEGRMALKFNSLLGVYAPKKDMDIDTSQMENENE